jgi:uncharacterized membrane protein
VSLVIVWVLAGVLGLGVLVIPALRLWRQVRALSGEVRRVAHDLSAASAELEQVSRELPHRP